MKKSIIKRIILKAEKVEKSSLPINNVLGIPSAMDNQATTGDSQIAAQPCASILHGRNAKSVNHSIVIDNVTNCGTSSFTTQ